MSSLRAEKPGKDVERKKRALETRRQKRVLQMRIGAEEHKEMLRGTR